MLLHRLHLTNSRYSQGARSLNNVVKKKEGLRLILPTPLTVSLWHRLDMEASENG